PNGGERCLACDPEVRTDEVRVPRPVNGNVPGCSADESGNPLGPQFRAGPVVLAEERVAVGRAVPVRGCQDGIYEGKGRVRKRACDIDVARRIDAHTGCGVSVVDVELTGPDLCAGRIELLNEGVAVP